MLPPALDAQCDDVVERTHRGFGRTIITSYADQCGPFPVSTVSVRRSFRYFVTDSIRADLFDPLSPPTR